MELYNNGLIIQKARNGKYQGVEGDNWFLNYEDNIDKEIIDYFDDHIDLAWTNDKCVDACNNMSYIKKYLDIASERNINYRIILCFTNRQYPKMINNDAEGIFLGYDYVYSGGSYYSAVLNDVISKRIPKFQKYRLNDYGLFDSIEELTEFVEDRNIIKENSVDYDIEDGDFIVYKLYETKRS